MEQITAIQSHGRETAFEISPVEITGGCARYKLNYTGPRTLYAEKTDNGVLVHLEKPPGSGISATIFESGQPRILTMSFELAMPANAVKLGMANFDITYSAKTLKEKLLPVQVVETRDGPKGPKYEEDPDIYSGRDPFPLDARMVVVDSGLHTRFPFSKDRLQLGTLRICLIQFVPQSPLIKFVEAIAGELECSLDAGRSPLYGQSVIDRIADNPMAGQIANLANLQCGKP